MELKAKIKAVKPEEVITHLTVNSKKHPFLKDQKIGATFKMEVSGVISGIRVPDRWEISEQGMTPDTLILNLKVTSLGPCGGAKEDSDSTKK